MRVQVNSEFHAFKHFEALGPGELQRAIAPLEAALELHPTLLLTNALPAAMDVVIWQVPSRVCFPLSVNRGHIVRCKRWHRADKPIRGTTSHVIDVRCVPDPRLTVLD